MKVVHVFSGGLDSTVLLTQMLLDGHEVICLGFNYGQRHVKELDAALKIAQFHHVPYTTIDLTSLKYHLSGSSQTDMSVEVPEGAYDAENMKATIVPNRNMVMLSLAAAVAIGQKADCISYAAHAGDHAIYPDCRPLFVHTLQAALKVGNETPIQILAPFIHMTKAEIVAQGLLIGAPLDLTWSCYRGDIIACGRCGTCVERLEAFNKVGRVDPIGYEDRHFWKTALAKGRPSK